MTTIQRIERKYNQKRRSRFLVWIIAVAILVLGISAQASPKTQEDIIAYTTLTVSAGDTIWELAEDVNLLYYENQLDMHDLVKHIRDVNGLNSVVIIEGQTLKVATNLSNEQ